MIIKFKYPYTQQEKNIKHLLKNWNRNVKKNEFFFLLNILL